MTDDAQKIKEFFDLPIVEHETMLYEQKPMPLGPPIAGDDILMATDEEGVSWIRTTDGTARMKTSNFL